MPSSDDVVTCGCSPLVILLVIILGSCMVISGLVVGSRRLPTGSPPMASSCSAAISAACQGVQGGEINQSRGSLRPVQWGVTQAAQDGGHSAFSSREVSRPVEGVLYAGAF